MRNHTLRGFLLATVTAVGLSACGGSQPDPGVSTEAPTILTVENQSLDAMTIYAWRSGTRLRLGTVNAGQTERFKLARTLFLGVTTLRVEADPLGRQRNSFSEEFTVHPGEEIVLRIPPT